MKTFRYKLGHAALITMTVGELRAKLAEYPDDMPVLAEWEGRRQQMGADFTVAPHDTGNSEDACDCLVVSAENGYYSL